MTEKRTKIVCTIGPSTDVPGVLEKMLQAGMNVARFNFSHGSHEEHAVRIARVREASEKTGIPVALLLDTKGPEIRLGLFKDKKIFMEEGQKFTLTTREILGDETIAMVSHSGMAKDVTVGTNILLSDGLVTLRVDSVDGTEIHTTVLNSGMMSDRKRVAIPGQAVSLPPVSEADEADLRFGAQQGMDYVAASFMQRGDDVVAIRRILESENSDMKIISKIENEEGVINIDDIIAMSDGVMVARGDLGVEIPAERVPILQKDLINKCNKEGKLVITATQMLESMTQNPRPTRAETSDVANAIIDGTDAVMLSGETASGKYPVEAVNVMKQIALVTEHSDLYRSHTYGMEVHSSSTSEAISEATVQIAKNLNAKAIITLTEKGTTALSVSKSRPSCPIIAVTPHEETVRRCQLYWGVKVIKGQSSTNSDELVQNAITDAVSTGFIQSGDLVVVTAGVPAGTSGQTNMIRVHVAGDTLLTAHGIGKEKASGRLCVAPDVETLKANFVEGDILVLHAAEPEFVPFIQKASAIIAEEGGFSSSAAIVGLQFNIPTLIGAENALKTLKTGMMVSVDSASGEVIELS